MDISQGIFFGTLAMLGWGASDFFVTKSARGCDPFRAFLWSQVGAFGVMIIMIIFVKFLFICRCGKII